MRRRLNALAVTSIVCAMLSAGGLATNPASASLASESNAGPSPRSAPGVAFDVAHGNTLLFGGFDGERALGDTWTWDGTRWTRRAPVHTPVPRAGMGIAYDAARGVVVLFGGYDNESPLGDTWTWDGTDWTK